jgi:hypothetical protein
MSTAVECPQRDSHLERYHDAIRAYREAVARLDADLVSHEFEAVHKRAEETRSAFERTREELMNHVKNHGCDATLYG